MRHGMTICALAAAPTMSPGPALAEEVLHCTSTKRLGAKAARGAKLSLVLADDGAVKDLKYSGYVSSGNVGGTGFCDVERASDDTWTWTRKGPVTILVIESPALSEKFVIEIEQKKDAYEVRFPDDSPLYRLCGAAAEFPDSVTIRKGSRICRVVEASAEGGRQMN